jgi:NitT/TauT family transport system substrate-binding protein
LIILIAILVLFTFTGCKAAAEPTDLDFRLNWTLYGEHAPFFLGVEKGFYEAEGLNVTILEGSGSGTVVKLLGTGENVLGYADSATMMRAVAEGVPVKSVAVIFQSSPMSFIYRGDAAHKVDSIANLKGAKIAVTAGDASLAILEACLGKNGMTLDDIELIQVSNPQAKEVTMLEGSVDAFPGYFVDQPLRLEKNQGIDIQWTQFTDICGVNTLSSSIIANNDYAKNNPEIVEKFVRASQRAWAYSLEHPEEAAEIFAANETAANAGFDKELSLAEIEGSLTLLHTPNSEGKPIGWSAKADWDDTVNVLTTYAGWEYTGTSDQFFTTEFISDPPYEP